MNEDRLGSSCMIALIPSLIISVSSDFTLLGGAILWAGLTLFVYLVLDAKENIEKNDHSDAKNNQEINKIENQKTEFDNNYKFNLDKEVKTTSSSPVQKMERKLVDINMPTILALKELSEIIHFLRPGEETTWLSNSLFKYGDVGIFEAEAVEIEAASMYIRIKIEKNYSTRVVEGLLLQKRYEIEDIIRSCLPDYPHAKEAAAEIHLRVAKNGDINKPYYFT